MSSLWDRRDDLRGVAIKTLTAQDEPYSFWNPSVTSRAEVDHRGIVFKVLNRFSAKTGARFWLEEDNSGVWGGVMDNGTIYGLVGRIINGEFNLGALSLTQTPERSQGNDFNNFMNCFLFSFHILHNVIYNTVTWLIIILE